VVSTCFIECSWFLRRSRACFQSNIPFLTRKCAHLVVSAHISIQVKHLAQVCEGKKQSQLHSTTSPLWFWQQIQLVVHFSEKFLSFCVVEHHVLKMTFHHNVRKNLFDISTNISAFLWVHWLARRPRDRYPCLQ